MRKGEMSYSEDVARRITRLGSTETETWMNSVKCYIGANDNEDKVKRLNVVAGSLFNKAEALLIHFRIISTGLHLYKVNNKLH